MSKVRSRLPPSFSVTVGMYATARTLPAPKAVYSRGLVHAAALSPSDFFGGLRRGLKSRLPQTYRSFEGARGHGRLLKLHFGHSEFHFEAWHHTGAGKLEVGLHFEGAPELNRQAFDFFRSGMVEIKSRIPRAELEPWDRGWSRLYATLAAPPLGEAALGDAWD